MRTHTMVRGVAMAAIALAAATPSAAAQGGEEQQFLFLLDPAYVQARGEWQTGLSVEVEPAVDVNFAMVTEVEYGITDRLQVQASLPLVDADFGSGMADASFGMAYAIVQETPSAPQLTLAGNVIAPTGDADDGLGSDAWGWEASLAVSKELVEGVFGHANLEHERTDGAWDGADEVDESEWSLGVGFAAAAAPNTTLVLEFVRSREETQSPSDEEIEYSTDATFGAVFAHSAHLEFGLGAGVRLDGGDERGHALLKVLYEW